MWEIIIFKFHLWKVIFLESTKTWQKKKNEYTSDTRIIIVVLIIQMLVHNYAKELK